MFYQPQLKREKNETRELNFTVFHLTQYIKNIISTVYCFFGGKELATPTACRSSRARIDPCSSSDLNHGSDNAGSFTCRDGRELQQLIVLKMINDVFYIFFIPSFENLVHISVWPFSVQICHISGAQQPHVAPDPRIGQHNHRVCIVHSLWTVN